MSRTCSFGDCHGGCERPAQTLSGERSDAENVTCRNTAVVLQWHDLQQVTETKCSSTSGGTDK